ncbi:hypothetical protein XENOCAPTIV_011855 [Xenoophorus captivus]|uniref:Uncharacterized protein n=1 Tax=Xenoophorus captivus TaxID=1517983 RepID=A0ABV0R4K7_9TELE
MKLPYCLCRELVVSVELCDCFLSPGPPECAFPVKDQNKFFFNSLCCLCMYFFFKTCWKSHTLQRNLTSESLSEVSLDLTCSLFVYMVCTTRFLWIQDFLKEKKGYF